MGLAEVTLSRAARWSKVTEVLLVDASGTLPVPSIGKVLGVGTGRKNF